MDVVDPSLHRVLSYLAMLEREGYHPKKIEVHAFATNHFSRSTLFQSGVASLTRAFLASADVPVADYIQTVGWASLHGDEIRLTDLGRALERSVSRHQDDDDTALDVLLDHTDPIGKARLMRRIADVGPAILVDPYFRIDDLLTVLEATSIDRILTSERSKAADLNSLRVGLASIGDQSRRIEVRVADRTLHDRHVIGDDGTVLFIGASLNGIGKATTVVGEFKDGAAAIASAYRTKWDGATPLEPIPSTSTD